MNESKPETNEITEPRLETPQELTDRLIKQALKTQEDAKALAEKISNLLNEAKVDELAVVIAVRLVDHYHEIFLPKQYAVANGVATAYSQHETRNA